jgi:zinc transport system substrate-binding protein
MRKLLLLFIIIALVSCRSKKATDETGIITVSIAPFRYFVEELAGNDFQVNIMVPAGSNPHIYEPYPEQISNLRKSVAYISNGFLGFENAWLDKFYEMNRTMLKLSLGDEVDPIAAGHDHEHAGEHAEGTDPHYWVSPRSALKMAVSVNQLLIQLKPEHKERYDSSLMVLLGRILSLERKAADLFSQFQGRAFMIYHPNLAYLARDYGLKEIPVEFEGKEPPPSHLKELIDMARAEKISVIFVQKEYDIKNAKAIADEINATVEIIDPLSGDWHTVTDDIITRLYRSFGGSN